MATYSQQALMGSIINVTSDPTNPAVQNGVNARLLTAIAVQESSFNPSAPVGSSGEVGPMQIIPYGKPGSAITDLVDRGTLSSDFRNADYLADPHNNVIASAAVLNYKAESNGANLRTEEGQRLAVERYNGAGPQAEKYANETLDPKRMEGVDKSIASYSTDNFVVATRTGSTVAPSTTEQSTSSAGTSSAGTSSAGTTSWDFSIMKFAKFIAAKTFYAYMQKTYEQTLEMSLHGFLATFMKKFYHYVQYIPTLPNCYAILVKPETPFIEIPSCNVIYPTIKSNINFSRNFTSEPTRLLVISDTIRGLFPGSSIGTPGMVNTLVFMDYEPGTKKETVSGINVLRSMINKESKPLTCATDFEMEHGIRIQRLLGGDDFYLFLIGEPGEKLLQVTKDKVMAAANTLKNLAKYHLLKLRYDARPGSTTMFFNPYIVPGFPMVSIEGTHESNLNITAYVTNVSHTLSPGGSFTNISFTGTHIAEEATPNCMPIIEEEYEKGCSEVFKNLFGSTVKALSKEEGVKQVRETFKEQKGTVSETLKTIWRPLTTLDEYMSDLAYGAKLNEDGLYCTMTSTFFKDETQTKIKAYSKQILEDQQAFYETDVR